MTEILEPEKEVKIQDIPEATVHIKDQSVFINEREYAILENYKDGLEAKALEDRYTQLLQKYDYLVGDWGYEQLRLKGFYKNENKKVDPEKRIGSLEDYLREYCAFGCAYFVLALQGEPIPYSDKEDRLEAKKPARKRNRRPKEEQNEVKGSPLGAKSKPKKKDYFGKNKKESAGKPKANRPAKREKNQFVIRQKGE